MTCNDPFVQGINRRLLPPASRLLVAVSGGADSVALLHALMLLNEQERMGWSLRVLHVDHGLREDEGARDAAFVLDLTKSLGLAGEAVKVDTAVFAVERRLSIEAAARALRYDALQDALMRWPGDVVVTGHTMDDQAETLMLNLLRGSGVRGLSAMAERNGTVVRPMLGVSKEQVLEFLRRNEWDYCEDSSNSDARFKRNLIRHAVMPALRRAQPAAPAVLARAASVMRTEHELIEANLHVGAFLSQLRAQSGTVTFDTAVWQAQHPSLRRHVIRLALGLAAGPDSEIGEEHVEAACAWLQGPVSTRVMPGSLPSGLRLELRMGECRIANEPGQSPSLTEVTLSIPGTCTLPVGCLSAELIEVADRQELDRMLAVCGPLHALMDAHTLMADTVTVRSWRPGDRILPLGMTGSKKLHDLFIDRRVPRDVRGLIPLIEAQTPLWVAGLALDRRVSVRPESVKIVHFCFDPAPKSEVVEFLGQTDPAI